MTSAATYAPPPPPRSWPHLVRVTALAAWRFLPVLLFAALWQLIAISGLVDPDFFPRVDRILAALWEMARDGELAFNLFVTIYRSAIGLVVGSGLGILIGMAMATSRAADRFFAPLVSTTYSLPKTTLVPLFILWFGIGDLTPIMAVVLACLLPVIVGTYHGIKSVPSILIWSAEAMGTPRWQILWRVRFPAALLPILTGVRVALGFSYVLTLSSEMIATRVGIGKLIFMDGENGAYAYMFAGILAVVVVAYLSDRGMVRLMHYLLRWQDSVELSADA
jgi:ABC-type nitrate/sulfonate/bicarbonate transport system permease component